MCECVKVLFNTKHRPDMPERTACILCDSVLNSLLESKRGRMKKNRSRGRGKGRGRGRGRKMDEFDIVSERPWGC